MTAFSAHFGKPSTTLFLFQIFLSTFLLWTQYFLLSLFLITRRCFFSCHFRKLLPRNMLFCFFSTSQVTLAAHRQSSLFPLVFIIKSCYNSFKFCTTQDIKKSTTRDMFEKSTTLDMRLLFSASFEKPSAPLSFLLAHLPSLIFHQQWYKKAKHIYQKFI